MSLKCGEKNKENVWRQRPEPWRNGKRNIGWWFRCEMFPHPCPRVPQLMLQFGRLWNLVGRRLAGESESLGTSVIILALPFLCSLSASQMWMQRDKLPPTPSPPLPYHAGHYYRNMWQNKASVLYIASVRYFIPTINRTTTVVLKYKWEP